MKRIEVWPIGRVAADDAAGRYVLEIEAEYGRGLVLEHFGRVQVLWVGPRRGRAGPALQFLSLRAPYAPGKRAGAACRSEHRPNPIALTSCGVVLVDLKEGRIVLDYIDAVDGTPLLDVKPYILVCDRSRESAVAPLFRDWPEWIEDVGAFFSRRCPGSSVAPPSADRH